MVASKIQAQLPAVTARVVAAGGPTASGTTAAEFVRFHDDLSTYTGKGCLAWRHSPTPCWEQALEYAVATTAGCLCSMSRLGAPPSSCDASPAAHAPAMCNASSLYVNTGATFLFPEQVPYPHSNPAQACTRGAPRWALMAGGRRPAGRPAAQAPLAASAREPAPAPRPAVDSSIAAAALEGRCGCGEDRSGFLAATPRSPDSLFAICAGPPQT